MEVNCCHFSRPRMEDDSIFHTAVNKSPDAFTAVADTRCSETCTNCLADFIPGSMWKLKVPIALGGIAGSLLVTHAWQNPLGNH